MPGAAAPVAAGAPDSGDAGVGLEPEAAVGAGVEPAGEVATPPVADGGFVEDAGDGASSSEQAVRSRSAEPRAIT